MDKTCLAQKPVLQRQKEYYETALKHSESTPDTDELVVDAMLEPETHIDVPMLEEVHSVIKKLQSGYAAGPNSMIPEFLRYAIKPISVEFLSGLGLLGRFQWSGRKRSPSHFIRGRSML